jgi:hypothetical protein
MPIQKFNSISGISNRKWFQPGTPAFTNVLRSVFWMAKKFAPPQNFPPGVHKFRDIEQSQKQKRVWAGATSKDITSL